MPNRLHLGCGRDYKPEYHNVDANPEVSPDEVVDLNETPWTWEDESYTEVRAEHVFEHLEDIETALREAERILRPGGQLIVKMPMGTDAFADPDHKHVWDWRTPEYYCGKRHWDIDVGLDVRKRDVELWPAGQSNILAAIDKLSWKIRMLWDGCGSWCFNQSGMSGEFTVVFVK